MLFCERSAGHGAGHRRPLTITFAGLKSNGSTAVKRTYINQIQAAQELGCARENVVRLLKARLIIGARKIGGRWQIPTPVKRKPGARGPKSRQALQRETFLSSLPQLAELRELHCCPVAELGQHITADSVDCIITDPPYGYDTLPRYAELGELAQIILKPGGSLVVMAGQSYLPEIMTTLKQHLQYQWMAAYLTPGGQAAQMWDRKVNTFWKPLLWFVKGEYTRHWIGDVAKSAVNNNDKRFHEWGQSESGMSDIVTKFSVEGDIILDPFLGGGTTAIVAISLGRKFIGADIDPEAIRMTAERLQNGA